METLRSETLLGGTEPVVRAAPPAAQDGNFRVEAYARPRSLEAALALLAQEKPWRIVAGGTDFYPGQGARPIRENILDIGGLDSLRGLRETTTHYEIGARATWADLIRFPLPPAFDALKQAAAEVGSVQIQNVATIAGNLCNASPAADGVPALMVLDAEVELRSSAASRYLPLAEFLRGNRRTVLAPDEMMVSIRIPKSSAAGGSAFEKLGARRFLVISIAMAAARVVLDNKNRIAEAAVSVGACSAVAMRLTRLEAALLGLPSTADLSVTLRAEHFDPLAPIEDVRGTVAYRREAAREIVARALRRAIGQATRNVAAA